MRGHIRKRGSKWAVVVDVGRDPDTGQRRQKWHSGFDRRKDAEDALTRILGQLGDAAYVEPSKLTVSEYLTARWLPAIRTRVRPSTWDSYRRNVERHLVPRLGHQRLQRLTGDQLNAMYAELLADGRRDGEGLSPRTVRYLHAIVRRALEDAVRWHLVARNVAEQADPPKQTRNREAMRGWMAEQLRAFLDHVRDDRLYALWLLLASTGMRLGEALGLGREHLDLDASRASVRRNLVAVRGRGDEREAFWSEPKTEKSRRAVALDPATVDALRAHRKRQLEERMALGPAWQDRGLLFCREDGLELDPDWVSKRFERLARAASLPAIRLHDLRHTHATLALQAGIHPKVVSERLGHSTVSMTLDTYSHAIPAMQEDAAAKVAALILGGA
jgi:integrase